MTYVTCPIERLPPSRRGPEAGTVGIALRQPPHARARGRREPQRARPAGGGRRSACAPDAGRSGQHIRSLLAEGYVNFGGRHFQVTEPRPIFSGDARAPHSNTRSPLIPEDPPIISGLAATIYFAWEASQIWSRRLVLDDVGVTSRIRPGDTGRLRWQEIADVQTMSRYRAVGGGVTKYFAELIRTDGQSMLVAGGTATQLWREYDLREFGHLVRRHLVDVQNPPESF